MTVVTSMLALGLILCSSSSAWADEASDLYKQGVEAFDAGRFADAAASFRAAHQAKPHWKLYYNIGQSEAAAKRHGLALQAFEAYLSQGGDEVPNDRREEVLSEVERLRRMVGRIEVTAPKGALIRLDGVARGTAPILGRIPVAASVKHVIAVEIDGELVEQREFLVTGGDVIKLELGAAQDGPAEEPGPEPAGDAPAPEAVPESAEDGSTLKTAGWVAVGLGGALLIGGGVTGGLALKLDGELAEVCVDGHCPGDEDGKIDKLDALATTSTILIGVGAAAAATGVILLIVGHGKNEAPTGGDVALAPSVGPGFGGFSVQGRF